MPPCPRLTQQQRRSSADRHCASATVVEVVAQQTAAIEVIAEVAVNAEVVKMVDMEESVAVDDVVTEEAVVEVQGSVAVARPRCSNESWCSQQHQTRTLQESL